MHNKTSSGICIKTFIVLAVIISTTMFASEISNQEIEYNGKTVTVPVSSSQINRIVLPSLIRSKIASDEKNIEIEINGREAFIKFSPIMETIRSINEEDGSSEIEDQSIKYASEQPTEVFFVTKDQTYSFIFVPSKMDAQTILVNYRKKEKEDLSFQEKSTPFTTLITNLVKESFSGKEVRGYTNITKNELLASNEKLDVTLTMVREGASFDIYMLKLKNKTASGVKVEERNFMGIIERPTYAISIFYDNELYEMPPFGEAHVAIVVAGEEQ